MSDPWQLSECLTIESGGKHKRKSSQVLDTTDEALDAADGALKRSNLNANPVEHSTSEKADSSCTVAATTKREFDKASEAASSATNCIATCSSEGEAGKRECCLLDRFRVLTLYLRVARVRQLISDQPYHGRCEQFFFSGVCGVCDDGWVDPSAAVLSPLLVGALADESKLVFLVGLCAEADAPLDGKGDGTEGGASGCATAADTCLDTLAQPSFSPPKQRRRRGPRIPAVATRSLPNRDSRIAADLQNKFVVECERKDKQSASAFGSSATSSSSARQPKKELSKRGGRPPRDRRKGRVVDSAPSRSRSGLSCSGAPRGRPRGSAKASRTNKKAEDGKSSLKASNPRPPPPTQSRRPRRHAADRAAAAIVAAAAPMHDGFLVLDIPAKRLRQQQQPLAGKKQQRRTTKWRGDEDAKGEDATTIQKREGGECLEEMRNEPKEGNPEAGLHAFKEEVDLTGAECRDEIANERREAQDPMQTELESKAESTAEELRLLEKALEEEEFDRRRVEPYELEVRIELGSP
ncbi:hypothetical protein cyc_01442 [Cyclospora cayetanensis]|uniref:Uncharacterized protein n=1 Tax=Cyclospora cayetanensis TaxID=88456 RepID=A0A1D3D5W6_9EIME|nr:hypothetical protein cyc_01442 [Cyclospora cayetanensis]